MTGYGYGIGNVIDGVEVLIGEGGLVFDARR